ncbi:MAG: hypothetical protein WDA42_09910, partial [Candidatus Bathyarchaeia archaeon]
ILRGAYAHLWYLYLLMGLYAITPFYVCASKAFGSKIVCLPVGFMVCWHNYNPSNPCFSSQHRILSLYIRTHQLGRLLPLRTSLLEANIERPKVYLIAKSIS